MQNKLPSHYLLIQCESNNKIISFSVKLLILIKKNSIMNIYSQIIADKLKEKKQFAVLIDPDKQTPETIKEIIDISERSKIDYFFIGGSLFTNNHLDFCITQIKEHTSIPVVLFPGNTMQINEKADAILFLSLISGRNPEMLIGKHVIAASYIKASKLEVIPTGYMIIDCGRPTAALYMSNSTPIPYDKDEIALCTAMAGEMLGLKMIYLDAGSGAQNTISENMIRKVKDNINLPLIVGGGIRDVDRAIDIYKAGADMIVIGNAAEKNPLLIENISKAIKAL